MPAVSARTQANRLNAQRSTGPTSAEGKANSSRNARKHGLFCKDVLLDGENAAEFAGMKQGLLRRLNPRDDMELRVCDQIVACHWRLLRLRSAERAAYVHEAQHMKRECDAFRNAHPDPNEEDPCPTLEPESGLVLWRMMDGNTNSTVERLSRYEQRICSALQRFMKELRMLQEQDIHGTISDFAGEVIADDPDAQNEANDPLEEAKRKVGETLYHALHDYRRCKPHHDQPIEPGLTAAKPFAPSQLDAGLLSSADLTHFDEPTALEDAPRTAA
jgi:hypothetical protein